MWMCPLDSAFVLFIWILNPSPHSEKILRCESHAAAAKTHLTGCGDRWCTAVQTLFFFNLCLFHFVFRSGLQILGSDRTMRTVMFFCFSISLSVSCVSGVLVQSPSCTKCTLLRLHQLSELKVPMSCKMHFDLSVLWVEITACTSSIATALFDLVCFRVWMCPKTQNLGSLWLVCRGCFAFAFWLALFQPPPKTRERYNKKVTVWNRHGLHTGASCFCHVRPYCHVTTGKKKACRLAQAANQRLLFVGKGT